MTDRRDLAQTLRRIRDRWHRRHTVVRDTLRYDEARGRYILDRHTTTQAEVLPGDLLVDGDRWRVFSTSETIPEMADTRTVLEDGVEVTYLNPTATSDKLYHDSDALNQASAGEFKDHVINPLVLALLIGGGILFMIFVLV